MINTIYIALCNNEKYVYEKINRIVKEYFIKKDYKFELIHFFSEKEFLKSEKKFTISLLDIDMLGIAEMEAVRSLTNNELYKTIALTSGKPEQFKEAFKIGAYRCVTKPIDVDELNEVLEDTFKSLLGHCTVQVKFRNSFCQIVQYSIDYIESCGDYVKIYVNNRIYESDKTLKNWRNELDARLFVDCHKSYIVNLEKIKYAYKNQLILKNGKKIPVSRRRSSYVMQKFMQYNINNFMSNIIS